MVEITHCSAVTNWLADAKTFKLGVIILWETFKIMSCDMLHEVLYKVKSSFVSYSLVEVLV